MRIGLDVHGVIDRFPEEFALLTRRWIKVYGHEVHVVTGSPWVDARDEIDRLGVLYTHSFSIVDHHRSIGTPMELKDSGWWMPKDVWDKTKGWYAKGAQLDIHFEDSLEYAEFFPKECTFVHVGRNFGNALPVLGDFLNAWDLFRVK